MQRLPTIAGPKCCALTQMSKYAEMPLANRSFNDLVQMATLTHLERRIQLHETLKVGLSRCAMRLSKMPFGFCNTPSVKKVCAAYVQNFQSVMEFEHNHGIKGVHSEEYVEITRNIFKQHRGTMLEVAKGVFEFYEDLNDLFGKDIELADVRDDLSLIRDVEDNLDQFFTDRLTIRLVTSHVHSLENNSPVSPDQDKVGVVNKKTQPLEILTRAYGAVRFMCMRDYRVVPPLLINGVPHEEYMLQDAATQQHFHYVHAHLFYIFLELVKNAARATVERAKEETGGEFRDLKLPPMQVFVPEVQSDWNSERSVKLADQGGGMNRVVLNKAFCYFYSSVKDRPTVAAEVSDFDKSVPLAGFGFGLPVSRVMARYFRGNLDLNSIPGQGTDAYIYL